MPLGRPVSHVLGVFHGRSDRFSSLVAHPTSRFARIKPRSAASSRLLGKRLITGDDLVASLNLALDPIRKEIGDGGAFLDANKLDLGHEIIAAGDDHLAVGL